jgi:hypothetical protein
LSITKYNPKYISTLIPFERIAALVIVKVRNTNGSNELAGDTNLTSKYCTFIDWQQSHQSGRSRLSWQ